MAGRLPLFSWSSNEREKTTFTLRDVEDITGLQGSSARTLILRAERRGLVTRLRPGLYTLVPFELGRATEYIGDPYVIAPPAGRYVELAAREPGRLRIAFSAESPIGTEVHKEAIAAVTQAAKLLISLGHDVVEDRPQYDGLALARCFLELYFGQVAATLAEARASGATSADFELTTLLLEALGKASSAAGKYSRNWCRSRCTSRVLSQIIVLWVRARTLTPPAKGLYPAAGRS